MAGLTDWYNQMGTNRLAPPGGDVGAGALQMRAGVGAGTMNPYDFGAQFHSYYGGVPAHQIVSGMQEGIQPQVTPAATGSPTNVATNQPAPSEDA